MRRVREAASSLAVRSTPQLSPRFPPPFTTPFTCETTPRSFSPSNCADAPPGSLHGFQMAKLDPFLSLDCATVEGMGVQSKEKEGIKFCSIV